MSVQPSTEWGILTLDENPPRLEGAGEVHGLVSNKVPRSIALRGNVRRRTSVNGKIGYIGLGSTRVSGRPPGDNYTL